jgi:hypothetical protein
MNGRAALILTLALSAILIFVSARTETGRLLLGLVDHWRQWLMKPAHEIRE